MPDYTLVPTMADRVFVTASKDRVEAAVERCLEMIDALGNVARLGQASAVLLEYDTVPVAISRVGDRRGCMIVGAPGAVPGEILRRARRLSTGQAQPAEEFSAPDLVSVPDLLSDSIEVGQTFLERDGQVATASVELVHGSRRVVATSVGRNAEERRLFLMAEAAARAVTAFLPPQYGVVLQEIHSLPEELGRVLKAAVLFLTPTEDQPLEGTAPVTDDPAEAAARTVVSAVQERVKPLLG